MNTLYHTFEDKALFSHNGFDAGFVSGEVEVTYDDDGGWRARSVTVRVEKGLETRSVYLDKATDAVFWCAVVDALHSDIDEAVNEALATDGIHIHDDNAEHYLSAAQLGVSIAMGAR